MSDIEFTKNYLNDLGGLLTQLDVEKIATAIEWMRTARDNGNTIYICGNGSTS